jgi:hypothetical protein
MDERTRENDWHKLFYALQRQGHTPDSAAAIATAKYGAHSDVERTAADHRATYQHLFHSTQDINQALAAHVRKHLK